MDGKVHSAALRAEARVSSTYFGAMEAVERRQLLAAHVLGSSAAYATIQAAINAAASGGVVTVDPGTYQELVFINKQLTVKGARAGVDARANTRGAESIVRGEDSGGGIRTSSFVITADNVTLDGFTVADNTSNGQFGAGIVIASNVAGTHIVNNVVQNNLTGLFLANDSASNPAVIQHNLFRDNNQPGNNTGRAIYTDGGVTAGTLTNVIIDGNAFIRNYGGLPEASREAAIDLHAGPASLQTNIRITNNIFDDNGKALLVMNASNIAFTGNVVVATRDTRSAALRFEGGVHDVTIQNNNIYNNISRAIRIDKKASDGENYNFVITGNNIYGNAYQTGVGVNRDGLLVDAGQLDGSVDARNNWWGSSTGPSGDGPGTGDAVFASGNDVSYIPWATAPVGNLQVPFFGKPVDGESRIDVANFDRGGEGVAYHDADKSNRGTKLHPTEAVDIQTTADAGSGFDVGYTVAGEWLEYTIDVTSAGSYSVDMRVASAQAAGGKFHLEVDGVNVTGAITAPNTGDWQAWQTVSRSDINLSAGRHVLRLALDANGSGGAVANFNWFKLTKTGGSQGSTPKPAAPSNLVAAVGGTSLINLTWTDNASDETGFKIERSTDNVTFTQIATTGANVKTFANTGLTAGTKYFYRVRASNSGGNSAYTNIASATTGSSTTTNTTATYIATGGTWKYLDNGSNQGTAWRGSGFNDASWKSDAAQLGYGDGDEKTVVSFGGDADDKYITTYFRKSFNVADASQVKSLALRLLRDDGAVVYLNGTEVFRDNMDPGTVTSSTLATAAIEDSTYHSASINPALLKTGANVIAVEIHQGDAFSSDISFDFELKGTVAVTKVQTPTPSTIAVGLSAPWNEKAIGASTAIGSAAESAGAFTVSGAGDDIWGRSDGFQFVYQQFDGDGTIVARVSGMEKGSLLSKSGVMIRQSLDADSPQAGLFVTPTNGIRFIRRHTIGGASTSAISTNTKGLGAPYWLKLVREGSTITAYRSADGANWIFVGSDQLAMSQTSYVGMAVTSHQAGAAIMATFDNVSLT